MRLIEPDPVLRKLPIPVQDGVGFGPIAIKHNVVGSESRLLSFWLGVDHTPRAALGVPFGVEA